MQSSLSPWRWLALSCAIALLTSTVATAAVTVNLRPQFQEGQTSRYEVWTYRRQLVVLAIGEQQRTVTTEMEIDGQIVWQVDRVYDDGSARCRMTIDWLTVRVLTPGGDEQFNDSRRSSGPTEAVHGLLEAMTGKPLTFDVDPDGSIVGVDGADAIRADAATGVEVPEDLDFIESATELATIAFAPEQLSVGQSFDVQHEWTHDMGSMRHDGSYELKSVQPIANIPVAMVEGRFDLELIPDMSQVPDNAPPMDVELLEGNVASQIMFDLNRHETIGRNQLQKTRIQITLDAGERRIVRNITEVIQSQALRISEQDGE